MSSNTGGVFLSDLCCFSLVFVLGIVGDIAVPATSYEASK